MNAAWFISINFYAFFHLISHSASAYILFSRIDSWYLWKYSLNALRNKKLIHSRTPTKQVLVTLSTGTPKNNHSQVSLGFTLVTCTFTRSPFNSSKPQISKTPSHHAPHLATPIVVSVASSYCSSPDSLASLSSCWFWNRLVGAEVAYICFWAFFSFSIPDSWSCENWLGLVHWVPILVILC